MSFYERLLGKVAHYHFVVNKTNISESFRPNQIRSKKWLSYEISKFKTGATRVAVLGSWNSILLYELLDELMDIDHWDFYDIDSQCHIDRDEYFDVNGMNKNYTSYTEDATKIDWQNRAELYDIIINPSCEHMEDIPAQIGPMYALTSNNYVGVEGHINTLSDYKELAVRNGINNILYEGSLRMSNYDRYCTIGFAK